MPEIPNIVFDQNNGPQLWLLNPDGTNSSSLYIDSNNRLIVSSSTNAKLSIESSSYALTASYAINGTSGGSTSITISDTPPVGPTSGSLWWDSTIGQLRVYYVDVDGGQWVDAVQPPMVGSSGTSGTSGITQDVSKYVVTASGALTNQTASYALTSSRVNSIEGLSSVAVENVAIGTDALRTNQSGSYNVAIGGRSSPGYQVLKDFTTGSFNTVVGAYTGWGLISGSSNTIIGARVSGIPAGLSNSVIIANGNGTPIIRGDGNDNFVFGRDALNNQYNYSLIRNVAIGAGALYQFLGTASSDTDNIAIGQGAMGNALIGSRNIAIGPSALLSASGSYSTVAIGVSALYSHKTGYGNVAIGGASRPGAGANGLGVLAVLVNGAMNVGVGYQALANLASGDGNIALGGATYDERYNGIFFNLISGSFNIGIGNQTGKGLVSGSYNMYLGAGTPTAGSVGIVTGSYNTIIGSQITGLSSTLNNTIVLGDGQGNIRQYIDSSGNVGIGKTTPNSKLDVNGNTIITGSLTATGVITGSLSGTSVSATNITASSAMLVGKTSVSNGALDVNGNVVVTGSLDISSGINTMIIRRIPGGSGNLGEANFFFGSGIAPSLNTTGFGAYGNIAIGDESLKSTTVGFRNVAIGWQALYADKTTVGNIAIGWRALASMSGSQVYGMFNLAIGDAAAQYVTTGRNVLAIGRAALGANTTGDENIAIGNRSMEYNVSGGLNIAIGFYSYAGNTVGSSNISVGHRAFAALQTGSANVGIGSGLSNSQYNSVGFNLITGSSNTFIGDSSAANLRYGDNNIFIGASGYPYVYRPYGGYDLVTASYNTIIGTGIGSLGVTELYNNIIIADGAGNIRMRVSQSGHTTFDLPVTASALYVKNQSNFLSGITASSITVTNLVVQTITASTELVTGSFAVSGSLTALSGVTGSLLGTASYATKAQSLDTTTLSLTNITASSAILVGKTSVSNGALDVNGNVIVTGSLNVVGLTTISSSATNGPKNTPADFYAYGDIIAGSRNGGVWIGLGGGSVGTNTTVGTFGLQNNTTGGANTAIGHGAMSNNSVGVANVGLGYNALSGNTSGSYNVSIGGGLGSNTIGGVNVGIGDSALRDNSVGSQNTAVGGGAGINNVSGSYNTYLGYHAGINVVTGSYNVFIGSDMALGSNLSNTIVIGDGQGNIRMYVSASGHTTFDLPVTASAIYAVNASKFEDGVTIQSLTASFISSSVILGTQITGSLLGTSSYASAALSSSYSLSSSYALTASYALNAGGSGPSSVGPIFTASAVLYTGSGNNANIRLVVEPSGDVVFSGSTQLELFRLSDTAASSLFKIEPTVGSVLFEAFDTNIIRMGQNGANALVVTDGVFYGTGSILGTSSLATTASFALTASYLTSPYSPVTSSAETNITMSLADAGKYYRTTAATAVNILIPPQSSVSWEANTEILFEQAGAGQITLNTGSGVTINTSQTLKTLKQYSVVGLKRVASDTWTLNGERA